MRSLSSALLVHVAKVTQLKTCVEGQRGVEGLQLLQLLQPVLPVERVQPEGLHVHVHVNLALRQSSC